MAKRRIKIPAPSWEHEEAGLARRLDANRWQLWATAGVVLLVIAALGVVGWAFLSDYIEDQQRPGSLGIRVADREYTVGDYTDRAALWIEQFGTNNALTVLSAVNRELIEESILLQFASERSVTATEDEVDSQIALDLGIRQDDPNFDARLQEELDRSGLSEEEYRDLARGDVLREKMIALFESEVPESLPSVDYRQIRVADQETADELVAQLEDGADFATLAAENSVDTTSAEDGGEKGWTPEGVLGDAEEAALFGLEPGEITTVAGSNAVFVFELLQKSIDREVTEEHRQTLGAIAYNDWLTEKQESVEIVNELDPQEGDGEKLGYVIDHADLAIN